MRTEVHTAILHWWIRVSLGGVSDQGFGSVSSTRELAATWIYRAGSLRELLSPVGDDMLCIANAMVLGFCAEDCEGPRTVGYAASAVS